MLKAGRVKVPHFAHWPNASSCAYANSRESEDHREAKIEVYRALRAVPGVEQVQPELRLGEVRPDVHFVYRGQRVALEIQMSHLSPDLLAWRTSVYTTKKIPVLWMVPLFEDLGLSEDRYAPRDWERYLHTLYFGKVYYWIENLRLQPIKYEPYMLAPSRYRNEKRSARYVKPQWLPETSILDLTVVNRKPWKDFPAARLWCEGWRPQN